MHKKYLKTSVCLAIMLHLVLGSQGSPAVAMMSENEAGEVRAVVARPCHLGSAVSRPYTWKGHHPKIHVNPKNTRYPTTTCPECALAGSKLRAHNAAKTSEAEETELRRELLRAQIAALKKSNETTFEGLKAQAEKIMNGMGPPPK